MKYAVCSKHLSNEELLADLVMDHSDTGADVLVTAIFDTREDAENWLATYSTKLADFGVPTERTRDYVVRGIKAVFVD